MVTDELINNYKENGFILFRNLIDKSDLEHVKKRFSSLVSSVFPAENKFTLNSDEWVTFAVNNPKVITRLYDQMRNDQTLLELGKSEKLTSVVKAIIPEVGLYKKLIFRIDVPFVTKELAFWHQDNFYVKGNSDEMTVWIPLFTTKVQHGCLSVMPKSHKLGPIPHEIVIGKKKLPKGIYDREIRYIEMDAGDILFFSSYLLHSSNLNFSDQIRYSIQLRYTSTMLKPSQVMSGIENV